MKLSDRLVLGGQWEWVITSAISQHAHVKHLTCIFLPKAYVSNPYHLNFYDYLYLYRCGNSGQKRVLFVHDHMVFKSHSQDANTCV